MKQITKQDVTESFKLSVYELIVKTAIAKTIREQVNEIQKQVLVSLPIFDENGNRIYKPDRVWLCRDEAGLITYDVMCHNREIDSGIKHDMPFNHCPALVAEQNQIKAERKVFDEVAKLLEMNITGKELNNELLCSENGLESRQNFLDMCIGLVLRL